VYFGAPSESYETFLLAAAVAAHESSRTANAFLGVLFLLRGASRRVHQSAGVPSLLRSALGVSHVLDGLLRSCLVVFRYHSHVRGLLSMGLPTTHSRTAFQPPLPSWCSRPASYRLSRQRQRLPLTFRVLLRASSRPSDQVSPAVPILSFAPEPGLSPRTNFAPDLVSGVVVGFFEKSAILPTPDTGSLACPSAQARSGTRIAEAFASVNTQPSQR
jgi:hypothetical protein